MVCRPMPFPSVALKVVLPWQSPKSKNITVDVDRIPSIHLGLACPVHTTDGRYHTFGVRYNTDTLFLWLCLLLTVSARRRVAR